MSDALVVPHSLALVQQRKPTSGPMTPLRLEELKQQYRLLEILPNTIRYLCDGVGCRAYFTTYEGNLTPSKCGVCAQEFDLCVSCQIRYITECSTVEDIHALHQKAPFEANSKLKGVQMPTNPSPISESDIQKMTTETFAQWKTTYLQPWKDLVTLYENLGEDRPFRSRMSSDISEGPRHEECKIIFQTFYDRLYEDLMTKQVPSCALLALPRIKSALNTKTRLTSNLSLALFPAKDVSDPSSRRDSYTLFNQWWKKSHDPFSQMEESAKKNATKLRYEQNEFKKARSTGQCCLWKKLAKEAPVSEQVSKPSAMKVDVSSKEELEPFFRFLKANGDPVDLASFGGEVRIGTEYGTTVNIKDLPPSFRCSVAFETNKDEKINPQKDSALVQFKRGVIYADGRIDLCKQVVGPDFIEDLLLSINQNPHIIYFLLGNNIIGLRGAKAIARHISDPKCLSHIRTWYLAGNSLDAEGIKYIADALKEDKYASSLWLKRNPLGVVGAQHLASMLAVNQTLTTLDLHNCAIFDEGVKALFEGLNNNTTLKHLYLDANGITEKGARYIAQYFTPQPPKDRHLESLWLEMNRMGVDGGLLISAPMKFRNRTLKRLALGSNRMTDEGMEIFFDHLLGNPSLTMLSLGTYKSTADMGELINMFSDRTIPFLVNYIQKSNLEILNLNNVGLALDSLEKFVNGLGDNWGQLVHLEFGQYGVDLPRALKVKVNDALNVNIQRKYGISREQFVKENRIRYAKHNDEIRMIDSVYRNNM